MSMTSVESGLFETGHVGLNVTDIERSRVFYEAVFGFTVMNEGRDPAHRFVFLGNGERLLLTLWQQSAGAFPKAQPGLHHLAFQVPTIKAVKAAEERVRATGVRLYHNGVVPHREGAQSGGIFFEDPDGIRLEIYAPSGVEAENAPYAGAPTCGFF